MRTARLPTIRVSVAMEGWVSPVYKFEQITSDDHQMSVAGGGATTVPTHGTGIPSPPPPLPLPSTLQLTVGAHHWRPVRTF